MNNSQPIYVSSEYGDDGKDGTIENPLRSIQTAIDRIAPGGTIEVRSGVYSPIVIDKPGLTLVGIDDPVIEYDDDAPAIALGPKASGCYVENITIRVRYSIKDDMADILAANPGMSREDAFFQAVIERAGELIRE